MKISIALCTYNGEEFILEQLDSFLKQTRLPDELIVCDDRSTDKTIEILNKFAESVPFPVRISINEDNLGSTKNFEKAISLCKGDLVFLSDQDDVWDIRKIERIETLFIENTKVGMIFTNAEIVDEKLISSDKKLWDFTFEKEQRSLNFFDVLIRRNVVTGATMAFRAKFSELFSPIPTDIPNIIHDGWISLVIAAKSEVMFINECLIKYRQHPNQQLGIDWNHRNLNRNSLYKNSIVFHQNELARLNLMAVVLRTFPQFQAAEIQLSIDKIIATNLEEKHERLKHYEARMNLSEHYLKRILPIFRELQSGRYSRFSKGWKSAVKDLAESKI
jgi:glycosyltransferase involved in cell wall biosynthesis